jgi:hypothetical protein
MLSAATGSMLTIFSEYSFSIASLLRPARQRSTSSYAMADV